MPHHFLAARVRAALLITFLALLLGPAARADAPDVYAITNARIVPVVGAPIARGTIVLRGGLIEAIGANVSPPADARVVDGKGLTVYPALVDALTRVGMPAANEYPATRGDAYPVATVRAENTAENLLQPDAAAFDALRRAGFASALVAPFVGIFPGQSALISLGRQTEAGALVVRAPVAAHLNFENSDVTRAYPASLMGEIAVARQVLYDALDAQTRLADYERDPRGKARPAASRALLALRPVVEKKEPLWIRADSAQEILRALKIAREFGLRPMIHGGAEAYRVVAELKAANAAVILSAALPEPPRVQAGDDDPSTLQGLRRRVLVPTSAAALQKAGVPWALSTEAMSSPDGFAANVRKMIAAGLPETAAIEAGTIGAARLLGVERQLGSLEPGKIASIVVVSGDGLFADGAKIEHLFVDGKKIDLTAPRPAQTALAGATGGGRFGGGRRGPNAPQQAPNTPGAPGTPPNAPGAPGRPGGFRRNAPQTPGAPPTPQQAPGPRPPATLPEAPIGANPRGDTDTTDQVRRLPVQTPTDPNPNKPPAAPSGPPPSAGPLPTLPPALPAAFVLRGATIWTVGPQGKLDNADVYIRDGKIVAVGTNVKVPAGTREIAARGKHVTPGMIDCHSHTAIEGGVNEGTNIVTAEVRIQDVLDADDVNIYRQLAGGTTAANVLHGSANSIGGQNAVVKWRWGSRPDDLLLKGAMPGIKFALGENPKRSNFSGFNQTAPRYPATRMGVEKTIRDAFLEARDYQRKWAEFRAGKTKLAPRRDLQLDALVEVLEGKRYVHCHSYRQDEILMMMRLAEEFGFRVRTFQHVLEGYKIADELAAHGAGGSTFSDWWAFKIEAWDAIPYNGALMAQRGVVTSFNSDSSELARRLNLEAAKAVHWGGMAPAEAIKLVTINPARQLGIDKMVGSIEPGKDADLVVWSGDPLSTRTVCEQTFVDGKRLFDRAFDLAQRKDIETEKKRLAEAERPATPGRRAPALSPGAPSPPALRATPSPNAGRGETETTTGGPASPAAVVRNAGEKSAPPSPRIGRGGQGVRAAIAVRAATGPVTAIVGGTIHPISGPDIPNGVVLMRGGKIAAVGSEGSVTIPADAKRVEAAGLHVYPGLLDADTTLGLTEIESIRATIDTREIGAFNPELRVALAVNPDSELIRVARANGVLEAITAPTGGTLSGMGALLQLDGWTWEDLAINPVAGLYVNFPTLGQRRFRETAHLCEEGVGDAGAEAENDPAFRSGAWVPAGSRDRDALRYGDFPDTAQGPQPSETPEAPTRPGGAPGAGPNSGQNDPDAVLRPLNNFLDDARRYRDARRAEGGKNIPAVERDPKFEAMIPVLDGTLPLLIRADRERDIRAAVAWAKKEGFRPVIVGGQEADKAADLLARENVPVILGPVLNLPARYDSPYDEAYTLPLRLFQAGVRFCLSTGDAASVRRLPYQAGMAAAFGLPADEALRAITLYPAQILGAGNRLGSLEPGKDATLIVTTGDPLEIVTEVKSAFIAGQPVDLNNKQLRLYEKYKGRPLPTDRGRSAGANEPRPATTRPARSSAASPPAGVAGTGK